MRSSWQILRGTYPSLKSTLQKQIEETEHKLLETTDAREWAEAHEEYLKTKLSRLQAHLKCLPDASE